MSKNNTLPEDPRGKKRERTDQEEGNSQGKEMIKRRCRGAK